MKCFALIALFLVPFQVFANPAAELNSLLLSMKTLRAEYIQTTTDPKFHDQRIVSGSAIISRPNQFRWEVSKPFQQVLIADGKKLWIYDADLEQVTVQPLSDNLKDTPALLLAGDPKAITEHFKVASKDTGYNEKSFELTPIDEDSLVRGVQLTFIGSAISRMSLIDNLHQIVTIEFSQVRINDEFPKNFFKFTPPAGVDVIGND